MTEPQPPADETHHADLRILATSDIHAHVLAYDYGEDREANQLGLARTATLIRAARAEAATSLLLDNGDFVQGTPLGDLRSAPSGPQPVIAAMDAAGVEVATLGNHDLNFGLDPIRRALDQARFPTVSANLVRRRGATPLKDETVLLPYTLLDRHIRDRSGRSHTLRIGVIGVLPPQVVHWDRAVLAGRAEARGMVEAARAWIPQMKAEGAEVVIALAHCGFGYGSSDPAQENAALALAGIEGIDALIAGHIHLVFPGPDYPPRAGVDPAAGTLRGKPTVMPGLWGSHLGVIDLALARERRGWRVAAHTTSLRPISARADDGTVRALVENDEAVVAAARPAHERTMRRSRRQVGRTPVALHSHFALLGPAPALRLVADAQAHAVGRALAGTQHAALPVLSAVAPHKSGGRGGPENYSDIPAGALFSRHLEDLCPYPNTLVALRLRGADLAAWLERAAGIFNTVEPGKSDQPLLPDDPRGYHFDVIHGLSYEIDLARPPGPAADGPGRVRRLRHRGRAVAPDAEFILATNNYRVDGEHYPEARAADRVECGATDIHRALETFVAEAGPPPVDAAPVWRFRPLAGTSILFETGPGAAKHASGTGLDLTEVARTPAGFLRYRLTL